MQSNLFLFAWCSVIALGNFHYGFSLNEIDQISAITPWIYGFAATSRIWMNLILIQIIPMMAALVSPFVYKVIPIGKRKILIITSAFIIGSSLIKMIRSLPIVIIGQMIIGACTGVSSIICPQFIAEIWPLKYRGAYIGLAQLSITTGIMASLLIGLSFPVFEPEEGGEYCQGFDNETSYQSGGSFWRYLFIIPAFPALLQIILLLCCFTEENPNYHGRRASSAYRTLEEDTQESEEYINSLNHYLRYSGLKQSTRHTSLFTKLVLYSGSFFLPGCFIHVFQQLTGINMVIYYSRFFKLDEDVNQLNYRLIVGVWNFILTPLSMYLAATVRRKPLFLSGFMIWAACWTILFQVFDHEELNRVINIWSVYTIIAVVFITIFIMAFSLTLGTITWVYTAEVLNDWEMGWANLTHWGTNFVIGILPMTAAFIDKMDEKDPHLDRYISLFFFLYSGVCLWGFFFTIVYIKESISHQKQSIPKIIPETDSSL